MMSKSELRRLNIQFEAKFAQLEAENDSLRQLHTAQMEENARLMEEVKLLENSVGFWAAKAAGYDALKESE